MRAAMTDRQPPSAPTPLGSYGDTGDHAPQPAPKLRGERGKATVIARTATWTALSTVALAEGCSCAHISAEGMVA